MAKAYRVYTTLPISALNTDGRRMPESPKGRLQRAPTIHTQSRKKQEKYHTFLLNFFIFHHIKLHRRVNVMLKQYNPASHSGQEPDLWSGSVNLCKHHGKIIINLTLTLHNIKLKVFWKSIYINIVRNHTFS